MSAIEQERLLAELAQVVIDSDPDAAPEIVQKALAAGISPLDVLEKGLAVGIAEVGDRFGREEIFLPELVMASEAMRAGIDVLKASWDTMASQRTVLGHVLLGTVKGDIHNIGKQIVMSLLTANGFEVTDLGVDVPTATFVEKVMELRPDIVGLSALLTTSLPHQRAVIEALKEAGVRDQVRVLIGGSPVTAEWAEVIRADGYAPNAALAVDRAKQLMAASAKVERS